MRKYPEPRTLVDPKRVNIYIEARNRVILKPLLEKHGGNVSAAVRECINFVEFAIKTAGSLERAKEVLLSRDGTNIKPGDRLILNIENVTADLTFRNSELNNGKLVLSINGVIRSEG